MQEKLKKLKELCDQFLSNIKEYKNTKYDEANTRVDFIDKFFELLGWDVSNDQGYAEAYRDVVREDKGIIEGKPKAPDYSFRIGGNRKFFLEAKKPSIHIKEEIEPAFQIRHYGYTAKNIAIRNKDLDIYSLNSAVQVIIDRIIFLRIAEDRNTEEYGTLRNATLTPKGRGEVYENLSKIFLRANDKYNSGLFKPEKWISELDIDDNTFQNIIKYLYYPDCPYELSVLPIEILGNSYEQFLGSTIRLTSSHQAKVEEKEEVRKAGGVYYTPQYIVNYIVQNTIGEMLRQRSETDKTFDLYNHPRLTILDPACGSGSFLVGTYSFLLDKYLEGYTDQKRLDKSLKNGLIYQVSENTYRLSITVKQNILPITCNSLKSRNSRSNFSSEE